MGHLGNCVILVFIMEAMLGIVLILVAFGVPSWDLCDLSSHCGGRDGNCVNFSCH